MIYFIVGTDTDCGKTHVAKKFAESKCVIKPIETGKNSFADINDSDCYQLAKIQNKDIKDINVYFFNHPTSPHQAADLDGEEIDIDFVKSFINEKEETYVELAGGLMVPLVGSYTQLDLIKEVGGEVILVIGNKLGCINHSLLTLKVLKDSGIKIKEVIFNDFGEVNEMTIENERIIRELGDL